MKTPRNFAIICLASGLILVISFIVYPIFFGNTSPNCEPDREFQFNVYNKDMNRSHTVHISVYNSSTQIQIENSYNLDPGKGITTSFHPRVLDDMNYSVTFLVDGNTSSHYDNIASSFYCSESFLLDPRQGVIRPYMMWC